MKFNKLLILMQTGALLFAMIAVGAAQNGQPVILADKGQTEYVIALATGAIPAEQTAAKELSSYLEQISGAKFVIKDEAEVAAAQPQILVGAGKRVKKLLPLQKWESLGADGIVLRTIGKTVILAGGRPRGSLYAVYSFLEDQLGVRWWTPEESTVPKRSTLTTPQLNIVYTPQLRTREAFYTSTMWSDPHFATRLKVNGHFQKQGPELGGHNSILGWCHTFMQLLPPEKYFKEHPEWYSDPRNNNLPCTPISPMPQGHTWQLCLSDEEARRELTINALKWIRANPGAGMISISQNDTHDARCLCPADVALEKAEGSPSGPLLRFVNQVAADIEKEYPDFLVETLAYNYTQKPPLHEKPRRNVIIRLCAAAEVNITEPLGSDTNHVLRDQVLGWKAIAPRLYIWNYVANFNNYLIPHPNLHTTGADIRFLTKNNTIALLEQGDAYNRAGDFTALRAWLTSHLMWDPRRDQRQVEAEFLNGYYGAAGPHLRNYLDIIQASAKGLKLNSYDYPFLTLKVMNDATKAFQRAQTAVAGDEVLSRRVLRERLALDHAWILKYRELRGQANKEQSEFEGPQSLQEFTLEFVRSTKELGVSHYSENANFASYAARLQARYGPRAQLPDSIQAQPDSDVLDVQDVSFQLYETGTLTSMVADHKASDGKAVKFRGNSVIWGVQYRFRYDDDEFIKDGNWRCYAVVRVELTPGAEKTGHAFVAGMYNAKAKNPYAHVTKSAEESADNEYHVYDLGAHALDKDTNFWIAPTNNPNVAALYIDRIVMVRDAPAETL